MGFLTAALAACALGIFWHDRPMPPPDEIFLVRMGGQNPTLPLLWLSCFLQLFVLCVRYTILSPFFAMLAILCAFRCRLWLHQKEQPKSENFLDILLLAVFLCTAILLIRATDNILADVMIFQRDSVRALLTGHNPYALTFSLPEPASAAFYAPGIVVDGRTQFGYPYLPTSLLWVTPFQLFAGDFRFGHLAALTIALLCIGNFQRTRTARLAAMALAFSTPTFFVLQIGWTEPVSAMLFCTFLWLHARYSDSRPAENWAFGWLLASKQYLVLMLPLLLILPTNYRSIEGKIQWRQIISIVFITAIAVLPFLIWNPNAFLNSAYLLHLRQQLRADALSYPVFLQNWSALHLPTMLGFVLPVGALWFCGKYAPRSSAGFAASAALVHFIFFAFNKQAFTNYYFFVLAILYCGIAAHGENTTNSTQNFHNKCLE